MHLNQADSSQPTRTGSCSRGMNTLMTPVKAFLTPLIVLSGQEGGSGNTKASLTIRIMESASCLWHLVFISFHISTNSGG